MKNVYLLLVIATAVLSGCSGKMSTFSYNEKIVSMHDKAYNFLNTRMETIYEHKISKDEASKVVDSLKTSFEGYVKEIKSLKIPNAAKNYNAITLQLFEYVKDSVIPLYGETLNFEPESEEWYKVWNTIDSRIKGRASQLEDKMIEEQQNFATATNNKLR